MKTRMIEAVCPHCGHRFFLKRDTCVLAGTHPEIERGLQDETWFVWRCSMCRQKFELVHPFYYRDARAKINVILTEQEEIPGLPENERVVVTRSPAAFCLAWKIETGRLNPALVLQVKKQLEARLGHPVRFEEYEREKRLLWFQDEDGPHAVSLSLQQAAELQKRRQR